MGPHHSAAAARCRPAARSRRPPPADTGVEDIIPLPNVPGKILAKVIEYSKYHVEANKKVDEKPAKSEDDVKQWDNEFVKVDQATLFDLILVRAGGGPAAAPHPPAPPAARAPC